MLAERDRAEDQRGHQGDGVGLEQVGGHAGAVADVVADVVGDRGGVARVVLGDALLDLAHEVGADVGRLREDAAADTHEHGEQRGTEAEALEHGGRFTLVDQHDRGCAEEAQADRHHADVTAGAERDAHRRVAALVLSGSGDADVRTDGEPHAEVADGGREQRAEHEEEGSTDLEAPVVRGQDQQQGRHEHHEDREGLELTGQVGGCALLDGPSDLLHLLGAFAVLENLGAEDHREDECEDRNPSHDVQEGRVVLGEIDVLGLRNKCRVNHEFPP